MGPRPLVGRVLLLAAGLGAATAWPARVMDIHHGRDADAGKGAEKIAHLGFAGMGYCPYAFFTAENSDGQGTLAAYILDAPSGREAAERIGHTLHSYQMADSEFLANTPAAGEGAYKLSGSALVALKRQFGTLTNARQKIGFCLTAMAAVVSGRPVVAGRLITCHDGGRCTVRVGGAKSSLLAARGKTFTADSVQVEGVSLPQHWPHGPSAIEASSARVVFARFWGLQAIVTYARIPVVHKARHPGGRPVLHMERGILVSFRGTTSFSDSNALQIRATTPGQRLLASSDEADTDVADKAGDHQWGMNMRTSLTNNLLSGRGGDDEGHPDAETIDGISHEAMLLVNGKLHCAHTEPHHKPQVLRHTVPTTTNGVCDVVLEMADGQGNIPVMTTGHSKGGALSILGAFLLRRCLKDTRAKVTTVVSVEGPRVGNDAFVERFVDTLTAATEATQRDTGWEFNVFRVVKKNDPVTEQPFPNQGDHRHVPGLLSVPVVTVLDVDASSSPPKVRLPPVFACDNDDSAATIAGWDAVRRQRGYLTLPSTAYMARQTDTCYSTFDGSVVATDLIQGGRLPGVTCNLCSAKTAPTDACEERDYRENGDDDQMKLNPFRQSVADRALITHPFFGPTLALCPADSSSTDAMVPKYQGGSHHEDTTIQEDAMSFEPQEVREADAAPPARFRSRRRAHAVSAVWQKHLRARG